MPRIIISEKYCKGCGLCVAFCPKGVLVMSQSLSARGVNPAEAVEGKTCTGCLNCAVMCPDAAIEITATNGKEQERHA